MSQESRPVLATSSETDNLSRDHPPQAHPPLGSTPVVPPLGLYPRPLAGQLRGPPSYRTLPGLTRSSVSSSTSSSSSSRRMDTLTAVPPYSQFGSSFDISSSPYTTSASPSTSTSSYLSAATADEPLLSINPKYVQQLQMEGMLGAQQAYWPSPSPQSQQFPQLVSPTTSGYTTGGPMMYHQMVSSNSSSISSPYSAGHVVSQPPTSPIPSHLYEEDYSEPLAHHHYEQPAHLHHEMVADARVPHEAHEGAHSYSDDKKHMMAYAHSQMHPQHNVYSDYSLQTEQTFQRNPLEPVTADAPLAPQVYEAPIGFTADYETTQPMGHSRGDSASSLLDAQINDKKYQCEICGKYFRRDLPRHLRTHQEVARFVCPYPRSQCPHKRGQFNRPYDFKKHLLHSHFSYDDPKMVRSYRDLKSKLDHMGTCSCGLRFQAQQWLDDHILSTENGCQYLQSLPDYSLHGSDESGSE